ncbi:MAG: hydrogenase expression/formation protein HypE [Planctomycetes bacterium]|nr:hydrogenase expression/formation protein HypE [Planctomycetota bacterium]
MTDKTIKLGHGSGGKLTHELIDEVLLRYFDSPLLAGLPDSARVEMHGGPVAFTTDTYVVDPPFFPGGNIGKLATYGTVNDIAVTGALPLFLSCGLILEEGFPESDLHKILASMQEAGRYAGVEVVTGDTKVVPRGKLDRIFINTAGIGISRREGSLPAGEIRSEDVVLVSGPLGDHGAAVLSEREGLNLESAILSDCAPVTDIAQTILQNAQRVPFLRDVTRGGLATILNEAVNDSDLGVILQEDDIPVRPGVRSICELLGLDPLYLACEGRVVTVIDPDSSEGVLASLHKLGNGQDAAAVGKISAEYAGEVVVETHFGTHRLVQMLSGEQLPRIC